TDPPTQLIPATPAPTPEPTPTRGEISSSIASTGDALRTIDAAGWTGTAADGFNAVFDKQPGLWHEAADAMSAAGRSLTSWSYTVEAAQARAAQAVEMWKQAEREELACKTAYAALSADAQVGTQLVDSWSAMKDAAREILRSARIERDGVAGQVAGALEQATTAAPTAPPFTERMVANVADATDALEVAKTNFGAGLLTGLSGIVQFVRQVNPADQYNLTHPAEYGAAMSDLATGLFVAAADPGAVVSAMVDNALDNPFEFAGSLTGDAILTAATAGAGGGVAAARSVERMVDAAGDFAGPGRLADTVADGGRNLPTSDAPRMESPAPVAETPRLDGPTPEAETRPAGVEDGPTDRGEAQSQPVERSLERDGSPTDEPPTDRGEPDSPKVDHTPDAGDQAPPSLPDGDGGAPVDAPTANDGPDGGERPNATPHDLAEADNGVNQAADDAGVDSDRTSDQNCEDRDPVDVATGEFLLPETDLTLPGVLPLVFGRRHRSNFRFGRWFGPSWSATIDMRVVVEESGVTLLAENGLMLTYEHPEVGAEVLPASGQRWPLTRTETGGYRVHNPDRDLTWHFAPRSELGGLDSALGNFAISAITDRQHNRILFRYGPDGAPTEIVHSGGYRVLLETGGGRVTALSVVDGDTATVVRRFDYEAGHLVAVTKGDGGTTRYGYDAEGRLVTWTDSNGNRMSNTYDDEDRVVVQHGTAGILDSRFDYTDTPDGAGRVTVVTDSTGATTTHGFDEDLRLRDLVDPAGGHTHTDYNSRREPLRVRTPDGAVTAYRYTPDGDVARITRPDGRVVAIDYAAPKRPAAVRNPDGSTSAREWDRDGNLTATVDAAGARTTYGYHPDGSLARVTGPTGATTLVDCADAGLPAAVTDPKGAVTRIDRDGFGRPTAVTDPTGATTRYRWSADGRMLGRMHPDGASESWEYDGEGNLLSHTDPVGSTTGYAYGDFDLLSARTDPDGSVTRYTWDTERRLTAVTNPLGDTWTYRYDRAGRLASETDFTGATTGYTHDAMGRVATVTAATGITRRHSYDVLGRLTDIRAESGEFLRFGHDPAGRVTSAVSGEGESPVHTVDFAYAVTGQLRSQIVDGDQEMWFEHDLAGRRTRRFSPGGGDTGWRWDPAGQLASLAADGRQMDFTHDPLGAVTGWKVGELAIDRSHTARGQLAGQSVTARPAPLLNLGLGSGSASGPTVLREDAYEYRPDGYLTNHTTVRGDATDADRVMRRGYALDGVGRITTVTRNDLAVESYGYDRLGNVVEAASGADRREYRGNLLIRDGRTRYHYDEAGRLVRKTTTRISRTADTWHYRYNAFDQLVGVTTPDGQRWRYTYDALGRRTTKARIDGEGVVEELTRYAWDGTQLVEQTHGDAVTRWTYAPGSFTPLTQTSSQGDVDAEFYAIVTDLVGTPVELIDPDSAEVLGLAAADLWGRTSWDGVSTPLRFPGQYHDDETGLHYNLHRYYDPSTARYVTQDPLGLAPAANPSAYPHNPTGWIDPLGLVPRACDLGNVIANHGPMNPGPLSTELAETFRSGTYAHVTTTDPVTLYRVFPDGGSPLGRFWTMDEPRGPLQSQLDSALNPDWGNTAENVASITVPRGTDIYAGFAAEQKLAGGGILSGGGSQIIINKVDPSWLN
ncbi:putative T7SS-secreted protein, partial [Rhodococcus sp. NPDC058514]|uniref:putative T7SS-secreted protein n=1 Tax=Rhodococcus sp. NPDC058514 TaxID=3346532 RepID=UPI003663440F